MQTTRSDRYDLVSLGATGTVQVDFLNKGMGLILQHALGASSGPTQQGATASYEATFSTNDTGPTGSYTWQMLRTDSGGTSRCFTYEGAVCTNVSFEAALGSNLNMSLSYDAEEEQTSTGAATPTYVASTTPFPFNTIAIEIDDSAVTNITGVSIDLDLGMRTDRRFLKGSATKSQPRRASVPAYSGTLSAEFSSLSDYNNFVAGGSHKLEVIATQATAIAGSYYPLAHLTMPAVRFEGSSPAASLDDLTTIELPFTILDNGSDAAFSITTQSTDTSF